MELKIESHTNLEGFFADLIREALAAERLKLCESSQAYLLGLVTEYADRDALYRTSTKDQRGTPALFWLYERAVTSAPHERFNAYRQLGDVALVVSGFFTPQVERSLVDVSYYVQMGGAAYSQASSLTNGGIFRTALSELSGCFARVVEVLTRVAEQTTLPIARDVAALYERWIRNPSSSDLNRRLLSQGLIPVAMLEAV
jgi:hypothetical protein